MSWNSQISQLVRGVAQKIRNESHKEPAKSSDKTPSYNATRTVISQKKTKTKTATEHTKEKSAKSPKTGHPSAKIIKKEKIAQLNLSKLLEVPHSEESVQNVSSDQPENISVEEGQQTVPPPARNIKEELSQKLQSQKGKVRLVL